MSNQLQMQPLLSSKSIRQIQEENQKAIQEQLYQRCCKCNCFFHRALITPYEFNIYCMECANLIEDLKETMSSRIFQQIRVTQLSKKLVKLRWLRQEALNPYAIRLLLNEKAQTKKCGICKRFSNNGFDLIDQKYEYVCRQCSFKNSITMDMIGSTLNFYVQIQRKKKTLNLLIDKKIKFWFKNDQFSGNLPMVASHFKPYEILKFNNNPNFQPVIHDKAEMNCPICMRPYSNQRKPIFCLCDQPSHKICWHCIVEYIAASSLDIRGNIECPFCRHKQNIKFKSPYIKEIKNFFKVDQQMLQNSLLYNSRQIQQDIMENNDQDIDQNAILPGCWINLKCNLKKHPDDIDRSQVVYGGCINYDVSKLDRRCLSQKCRKRKIFASSIIFSECRGSYMLSRPGQDLIQKELYLKKGQFHQVDLTGAQMCCMEIKTLKL